MSKPKSKKSLRVINGNGKVIKVGKMYVDEETGDYVRVTRIRNKDKVVENEAFTGIDKTGKPTFVATAEYLDGGPITTFPELLIEIDPDEIRRRYWEAKNDLDTAEALLTLTGVDIQA